MKKGEGRSRGEKDLRLIGLPLLTTRKPSTQFSAVLHAKAALCLVRQMSILEQDIIIQRSRYCPLLLLCLILFLESTFILLSLPAYTLVQCHFDPALWRLLHLHMQFRSHSQAHSTSCWI